MSSRAPLAASVTHSRSFRRDLAVAGLLTWALSTPVLAQRAECREPTAQEQAAVVNAQRILRQVVDATVTQLGWKLQSQEADGASKSVANDANPKRPLMRCAPIYSAKFDLTPANPQYATLHAKADKAQDEMNAWMAGCIKSNYKGCDKKPESITNGERASAALSLEIRALENSPYMHLTEPQVVHKLDVPGAGVAWRSDSQQDDRVDTTLCAGAWKPEVVFSNGRPVLFPFQHPVGTPFIENLCVSITATAEMADQIVKSVDWKELNAALTK